jgi:hypothetical protein
MSGVFSIASHSTLQYFSDVTLQEQTGCAHFLLSAIFCLLQVVAKPLTTTAQAALVGHQVNGVYRGHREPAFLKVAFPHLHFQVFPSEYQSNDPLAFR